jgi:hypothetical protein
VREIFGSNQLRKTLTIAVRETYLTSIAGSAVIEINGLREEDPGRRFCHHPLGLGTEVTREVT